MMNVNMNKLLVNMSVNSSNDGKLELSKNDDSFSKIMTTRMQGGSKNKKSLDLGGSIANDRNLALNDIVKSETLGANSKNIMDLILNVCINDNKLLSQTDGSEVDISNNLKDLLQDSEVNNISKEINYNNLSSMILGISQNISYNDMEISNPEKSINLSQSIQQSVITNNLATGGSSESRLSSQIYEKNIRELSNSELFKDYESVKLNSEVKAGTRNVQQNYEEIQNVAMNESKIFEVPNNNKNITDTNFYELKENLLAEDIESKKEFKDQVNLIGVEIKNNEISFSNSNKIIEVSDESAKIKNPVLTQVEDKIVMMSKDGIKHVNMELFPEHLGKIDIKMSIEKDQMTVEIVALNKETEKILMSHADELVGLLNKSNDTTVNIIVKPNGELLNQYQQNGSSLNYQNNERENQNNNRNYTFSKNTETDHEDSIISEIINLRNLKLDKVV